MVKRRNEKIRSAVTLEAKVTDVLVVENGALQPYIKIFHYLPENVAHESLGMLLGVFEIGDRSESSAYIVNFLASVAKKEYFSQTKRGIPESLEATLHKINRALAELVKQGNTEWLGTLQGAVCVVNQGTLHFSVTGAGHVILIRNEFLSVVSEGLSPEEAFEHPLKTFAEISSGRLQDGDTIIISTPEIFDILTPADIERASKHFPRERLSQFLRTAMVNQLPLAGAFVVSTETVSVTPKVRIVEQESLPEKDISNVFSQSTFHGRTTKNPVPQDIEPEAPASADYTDSQTGHIYVQGEVSEASTQRSEHLEHWQMRLDDLSFALRRLGKSFWYNLRSLAFSLKGYVRASLSAGISTLRHSAKQMKYRATKQTGNIQPIHTRTTLPETASETIPDRLPSTTPARTKKPAPRAHTGTMTGSLWKIKLQEIIRTAIHTALPLLKRIGVILRTSAVVLWSQSSRISHSLWKRYRALNRRKQLTTLGVLAFVLFSGIWYLSHRPAGVPTRPAVTARPAVPTQPVVTESHLETTQPTTISQQSGIVNVFALDATVIATTASAIITIQNGTPQSYPIPAADGQIRKAALISSLRTVFLLTDNGKLLSFTPANHAFAENTITISSPKDIVALSGYLSYLYTFNPSKNEILRYPRTDGGFGTPVSWLKETTSLGSATSIATDSRLLVTAGTHLLAFSRGKTDPTVTFENSTTPINYTQAAVHPDTGAIYVLDANYGRVIAYDTNGQIQKQYASPQLKQATGFALDTTGKRIVFSTGSGVFAFPVTF